jgi:hypothetical protein
LAGDVEGVARRATEGGVGLGQAGPADRAAEEVYDVREHGGIVADRGAMESPRFLTEWVEQEAYG